DRLRVDEFAKAAFPDGCQLTRLRHRRYTRCRSGNPRVAGTPRLGMPLAPIRRLCGLGLASSPMWFRGAALGSCRCLIGCLGISRSSNDDDAGGERRAGNREAPASHCGLALDAARAGTRRPVAARTAWQRLRVDVPDEASTTVHLASLRLFHDQI